MGDTIYRVMGKRGRITIPYEFRQRVGFGYNDILSFTRQDDNSVLVKREHVCDDCKNCGREAAQPNITLLELLDSLTPAQKRAALLHLSVDLAKQKGFSLGGGDHE
jgi:bifunctional DNA-binding transcriptional regulator/antitoxin component of YhaV-PrlF toxin-antitoxin module